MKKASDWLTCYLIRMGNIQEEDYNIYCFGFQVGFEVILSFLASISIALYLHMLEETIIFFLFFIPLRAYAGGFHLKNYMVCFVCSNVSLVTILLLEKNVCLPPVISAAVYLISAAAIKYLSHSKNTEDAAEKDSYSKKLNITLAFFSIVVGILFFMQQSDYLLLIIAVMILEVITLLLKNQN